MDLSHLIGKRIKLIQMGNDPNTGNPDPNPIPNGEEGLVTEIYSFDDMVGVKWDNGRGLNLIHGVDTYEVLN